MAAATARLRQRLCGCAPDEYAWEVVWWGIDEDDQSASYFDQDPLDNIRLYGMVNFAGLEYDSVGDGTGWRPVNEYYGYALPIDDPGAPADGDLIVLGQRTRSYFSAQNLELNLIRFPMCYMGCGNGCGSGACGGDCGYGPAAVSRSARRLRSRCMACAASATSAPMTIFTTATSGRSGTPARTVPPLG
jgi:hypothetical protein